jgi:hypothetical protein
MNDNLIKPLSKALVLTKMIKALCGVARQRYMSQFSPRGRGLGKRHVGVVQLCVPKRSENNDCKREKKDL